MEVLKDNDIQEGHTMNNTLQTMITNWQPIAPLVSVPYTEAEYQERIALLNDLIDEVGENEAHPLASLLDIVGIAVSNYEQAHYPVPTSTPQDVLTYLMAEHQLKQSDLPEIGSQGVISEILRGKRQLNTRQIQALAQRFNVSADVFFA
ncbi:MAG: helix-turn-helix domain-containing protein [Methylococcaceae bacterium]